MTIDDIYQAIAEAVLRELPSDDDALALMVLLHTHNFQLGGGVTLTDRPGVSHLAAITQRHAAEVMAAAWPDRADRERTSREHWYYAFNTRSPFEVIEDIPPEFMRRLDRLRHQLINSGLVVNVEPED